MFKKILYLLIAIFSLHTCFAIIQTEKTQQLKWKNTIKRIPPYPEKQFDGRGIVVCAGNPIYLLNAWIHLNILRQTGCTLPVELWYYGESEICPEFIKLFQQIEVNCRDLKPHFPYLEMGFQFKPFAIATSKFEEILLLDADILPLKDPEFLFDLPEFEKYGAIFWPDLHYLHEDNPIWNVLELPHPQLPAATQESGQIVINKKKCWDALQLTLHLNEEKNYYYNLIWGDKDSYHLSFRMVGKSFYVVPFYPACNVPKDKVGTSMIQRDLKGDFLFYHLTNNKFRDIKNRYRLINVFYFTNTAYEFPKFHYLKKISNCIYFNGIISQQAQELSIYHFKEQYGHLENKANHHLLKALQNPDIKKWVKENFYKKTGGRQKFRLRGWID